MTIWIGTGGTPISSRERSTLSGLERIRELGLNCMEVEFVHGVRMKPEVAEQVGELAKKLKIRLSIHAPYYINLTSTEKEKIEASKKRIIESCERGHDMGAKIVVFHAAYYGKLSPKECYQRVRSECEEMVDKLREKGITNVLLGLETTGKVSQFGTVDECVRIAKEVKGCDIVIDWGHIHSRTGGGLRSQMDYKKIFEKVSILKPKHLHTHFSGMEFTIKNVGRGNEKKHLPIDVNNPPFKPLSKEILERKIDITLISESPILEQDSLKMREVFEKLGYKI